MGLHPRWLVPRHPNVGRLVEGDFVGFSRGGRTGGGGDFDSTYRKVFRLADMMREVGADVYHRDWGWWDRAGDWNGPDFRTMGDYLRSPAWVS